MDDVVLLVLCGMEQQIGNTEHYQVTAPSECGASSDTWTVVEYHQGHVMNM